MTLGYRAARAAVRGLLWFLFAFRTAGGEHCPRSGPVIAAANHLSWLDPIVHAAALPRRAVFMAAEDLLGERVHPGFVPWEGLLRVIAPLLRWYGVIPVPRTEVDAAAYTGSAYKAALRLLRAGGCLAIYPEGGINRTAEPLAPLRNGVALLSARAQAPVLPMWLFGTDRALPLGSVVPRPARVSVRFGPPLPPPQGRSAADVEATTRALREAMLALYRQGHP
ncbi:MAG: lysophospholipid acyltransferase family protein [Armatimonadota bacterium]|nr:lysophospholipid acyltransferase family protein [Armatimonadota bacterium]MDR5696291.1 lysophospholipid acyltransferase family protein [Armatimonadota bacterium]